MLPSTFPHPIVHPEPSQMQSSMGLRPTKPINTLGPQDRRLTEFTEGEQILQGFCSLNRPSFRGLCPGFCVSRHRLCRCSRRAPLKLLEGTERPCSEFVQFCLCHIKLV